MQTLVQHIMPTETVTGPAANASWQVLNYGGQIKSRLFGMDRNEPTKEGARD